MISRFCLSFYQELIQNFISSRRQGLSPRSIEFYQDRLTRAKQIIGTQITHRDIAEFFNSLSCSSGGKHAYWRALTVFYHWLYSPKAGLELSPQNNPMLLVESPKVERKILDCTPRAGQKGLVVPGRGKPPVFL